MGKRSTGKMIASSLLFGTCVSFLCGILVAGLWPFHAPKNAVSWLNGRNGLLFADYGTILSSHRFNVTGSENGPCSLEIWIQSAATFDSNNIIAFSTPQYPVQFAVAQSGDDLFVRHAVPDGQHRVGSAYIALDHVFRKDNKLLITITSGRQGAAVYLNGVLVKTSPQFALTSNDFTGELVFGNSPVQNNTWGGQLWGLGIFDRDLTAAQVLQHYDAWTKDQGVELIGEESTRALYLFNEHIGRVVHNQIASEPDLYIPEHYFVLHPKILEPPWKEFEPNWTFGRDVVLNVVAFIPLGFFFCAYFSSAGWINRPVLFTIILGGAVSLTIEILQAYLPTRDSGMTDIITNTSGTALGTGLYIWLAKQTWLGRLGIATHSAATEKELEVVH